MVRAALAARRCLRLCTAVNTHPAPVTAHRCRYTPGSRVPPPLTRANHTPPPGRCALHRRSWWPLDIHLMHTLGVPFPNAAVVSLPNAAGAQRRGTGQRHRRGDGVGHSDRLRDQERGRQVRALGSQGPRLVLLRHVSRERYEPAAFLSPRRQPREPKASCRPSFSCEPREIQTPGLP